MVYVLCLLLLLRRGRVCVEKKEMICFGMPKLRHIDTLPEWSKGVDSSSTKGGFEPRCPESSIPGTWPTNH